MDHEQFKEAARSSINEIAEYNRTIETRPVVSQVAPGYLAKLLPSEAPEDGEAWSAIQADIETKIQPGLTHWQSPRYMAWFPASTTYPSLLGEMFSAAFTSANFNWICSPAVTELETIMLDWVGQMLHLPDVFLASSGKGGGGCIQGTASEGVVTCMVAARERYLERATVGLSGEEKDDRMAELRGKLVALGSEQAHSCTAKGARIAGVRYRTVPTKFSDELGMTPAAVGAVLDEVKAKGLIPFYITTSYGTTGTCAIDDTPGIHAELTRRSLADDIWVHVDAAYAGVALCLPEYAERHAAGMAVADSFETNMHKWGLVNFDAACMWVRSARDLTDAYTMTPSYLRNDVSDSGLVTDYRDWGIPLGRRFRALKIWFVLRTYGTKGFREHIAKHIAMGERFADLARTRSDILRVVVKPAFALTVIQCVPPPKEIASKMQSQVNGHSDSVNGDSKNASAVVLAAANELTKAVYEEVNRRGDFFLTSSIINGAYVIRVVSANPNAEMKYLERAFETIVQITEEMIAKQSPQS